MKALAVIIGVLVIVVLLVSSGVIAGAFCVDEYCIATNSEGISVDKRQSVTIVTGNP